MAERPMYALLADQLRREIREGKWKVGELLPTEKEIAIETSLSRSTVRAALQELVNLGLVTRHKAVGTKVRALPEPASYATATSSMQELVQFGLATDREIISSEDVVADDELAKRMGCRPGSKWVRLTTLRTDPALPDAPIGWTQVFLNPKHRQILPRLQSYKGLIAEVLLEDFGIEMDEIEQIIRPIAISTKVAELLGITSGTPALEVMRRYISHDKLVFTTFTAHPVGRFSYRIGLKRKKSRETTA